MVKLTPLKDKKCKECKTVFTPRKTLQTYCGHRCANTAMNRKRRIEVKKNCKVCGKEFIKRPSDVKIYYGYKGKTRGNHCSHRCFTSSTQTVTSLKKRVWSTFSIYIKNRDNWTCYTCGKQSKGRDMHAGHYISRRYNSTFLDEDNVHAQCARCNMFGNGEHHLYTERLIKEHGIEFVNNLITKSKEHKKFTKEELLDLYRKYKDLT